ncbi:hypothetical protein [Methanothermococcus sp.]|uniref:hypothetical protein n=1 Tax=Methanothermococcus sp. TaxID=2614238 RepID=UPI0025D83531|nr:hypothetical protein [Methanothermococcus sp.]
MNIHDITHRMGIIYQHVLGDDNDLEKCFLRWGAELDEDNWEEYSKALAQWKAIKEGVEMAMEELKLLQKWMEEMGYDEDIDEEDIEDE